MASSLDMLAQREISAHISFSSARWLQSGFRVFEVIEVLISNAFQYII
jgi:hypothetical protein